MNGQHAEIENTWLMFVDSLTVASGWRLGWSTVGMIASDVRFPPKLPEPTTKMELWLKATFSPFSSKDSTVK